MRGAGQGGGARLEASRRVDRVNVGEAEDESRGATERSAAGAGMPWSASTLLMHFAFVLSGLGTAMLGPILPVLARRWHLSDQEAGLLLLAQFCGSFLGGATMTRRLGRDLLLGLGAAAGGLAVFALAPGLPVACPALLVAGWGLGHTITAINILAGQRFVERRASRLALLNFFWSFGAMLAPVLAALLLPHVALPALLLGFAGLFAVSGVGLAIDRTAISSGVSDGRDTRTAGMAAGLGLGTFLLFCSMLFLYGGLETCLSGWLTTYALRYSDRTLALSQSATLLLWLSLTVGRGVSAAVLRRVRERALWRGALVATTVLTVLLAAAHTAWSLGVVTALLGLSLGPWFPVTFSLLMGRSPTERQAGLVIAVSGLGAAALPWLMGVVSTASGSLERALLIPFLAAMALLSLSLVPARAEARR